LAKIGPVHFEIIGLAVTVKKEDTEAELPAVATFSIRAG